MASQESLSLLRDFTINKKPVQFLDDSGQVTTELKQATEISFAETKFPKTTITKYKKSGSEEFYTLDTLVFLVQNISLDYGSLLKESLSAGIPTVSYIDRKDLLDYLTGVIETSPNVVTENAKRPPEESKKEIEDTTKKAKTSTSTIDPSNDAEFSRKLKVRERELNTKETILKGTRSFSFIQKKAAAMIKDIEKELVELKKPEGAKDPKNGSNGRERPSHPAPGHSTTRHSSSSHGAKSSRHLSKDARTPIIIVPAAATSLITLYNIKPFLEEHKYIDTQSIRDSGVKKPHMVEIKRKKPGQVHPVVYQVFDSVDHFKSEDWERVVCVFTTGAAWQFKNWVWQSPSDVFNQAQGFYVDFADNDTKDHVRGWNVHVLRIHRTKRHTDKATIFQLWDTLDAFCHAKKPQLIC